MSTYSRKGRRKTALQQRVERIAESIDRFVFRQVPVDENDKSSGRQPALKLMLERAVDIVAAGGSVGARVDGYPSTTPGNGSVGAGGGMMMEVGDDDDPDRVPTSSTEAAAITNLEAVRRRQVDQPSRIASELLRLLDRIEEDLVALASEVNRWERLRTDVDTIGKPQCYVASVVRGLPYDDKWEPAKSTTFEGVLASPWDEERKVCRWVYDFTRAHGRLPERDEMQQYLERGYVKVTAAP